MCEMIGSSGISAPDGAFLKVSLQNVAARKSIFAQMAHIWSISRIYIARLAMLEIHDAFNGYTNGVASVFLGA
jgi:hypothetical protein